MGSEKNRLHREIRAIRRWMTLAYLRLLINQ